MSDPTRRCTNRRLAPVLLATTGLASLLAACDGSEAANAGEVVAELAVEVETGKSADVAGTGEEPSKDPQDAVGTLDSAELHEISIELDPSAYDAMIETYRSSQEKDWIEASVTIDGTTYERVGIRLKGNSSLRGLAGAGTGPGRGGPAGGAAVDEPERLPWLIRLDKFVDGQSHEGLTELVVRSNNTQTSLNEAVALELLERAGLASQDAIMVSFTVNGSEPVLRLAVEHPDDRWMAEVFDAAGALYKAESGSDYSYLGADEEAYDEVFDQEAGKENVDLTPLIEFLEFINTSSDADFESSLDEWLDIDSFLTYLAMQDLLGNSDDIDGPGSNSYLYWDPQTGRFTVVPWDYNLAFAVGGPGRPGAGGLPMPPPGSPPGGVPGAGAGAPVPPGPGGGAAAPGADRPPVQRSNVLVERVLAVDGWRSRYEELVEELRAELFTSGVAVEVLEAWKELAGESGLVDAATIEAEAARIESRLG